ncbi:hypothetical protein [Spongiivirga citrea]|uniref:Uncharacterized protein n=1 Tax=Spongiivirga citrea TaxID=1481457 RepID=A0A6M0CMP3_9FLAO|nr:hypothetical protein [Spongiivirga citrea]NER17294.1 hypothetical protein [Spongiivirga citrea]
MTKLIVFILCASLEVTAQIKVPNGNFNQFETISTNKHVYDVPKGWKEHQKNDAWRQDNGRGFAYKYDLPDANGNALALHREYFVQTNAILTSFLIPENKENLRLVGRYKFSGSDIDTAKDTLCITVFSSERPIKTVSDTLPEKAVALNITTPKAQFEWFHLDVNKIQKNNYLTIIIQLKSGSDDSYYWGQSNAVLDDLKFITIQNLTQID